MKLRYVGAHTAVDVPVNHFDALTVNQGEEADIPDLLAASLLEQENAWEAVEETPPATRRGGRSSAASEVEPDADEPKREEK